MKQPWSRWRADFFAGLAVMLPGALSIAVLVWLFGTVSNLTDWLLFFLPHRLTHGSDGTGPMRWYWSLAALALAVVLVSLIGRLARNFLGRKAIELVDAALLRVPLLNKIYGTTKQVNEALTSSNRSSFKQVVLVEFPRAGQHTIGFLTGDRHPEIDRRTGRRTVCVFVPTTPNPTSGFLLLVPEDEVVRLDMSVTEGIKFIISLGAIAPENRATPAGPL